MKHSPPWLQGRALMGAEDWLLTMSVSFAPAPQICPCSRQNRNIDRSHSLLETCLWSCLKCPRSAEPQSGP